MTDSDFPKGIGPHEGQELTLLLSGEKPVARFSLDGFSECYELEFSKAVNRGDILEFDFPAAKPHLHHRYYCLRGEEWRVKLMELIWDSLRVGKLESFSEEDLHRLDGTLLGYAKTDINIFIEQIKLRKE